MTAESRYGRRRRRRKSNDGSTTSSSLASSSSAKATSSTTAAAHHHHPSASSSVPGTAAAATSSRHSHPQQQQHPRRGDAAITSSSSRGITPSTGKQITSKHTNSSKNNNNNNHHRRNHNPILLLSRCCSVLLSTTLFVGLSGTTTTTTTAFHQPLLLSSRPNIINGHHDHYFINGGESSSRQPSILEGGGSRRRRRCSSSLSSSSSYPIVKGRIATTKLGLSTNSEQQKQTSPAKKQSAGSNNPKKSSNNKNNNNNNRKKPYKKKRKYSRKLPLSPSEKAVIISRKKRRQAYEKMRSTSLELANAPPSLWSFDALFPKPVLDEESVRDDLFGSKEREEEMKERQKIEMENIRMKKRAESRRQEERDLVEPSTMSLASLQKVEVIDGDSATTKEEDVELTRETIMNRGNEEPTTNNTATDAASEAEPVPVDKTLTRMVEDRIYGLARSEEGSIQYSTSMLDSSRAVQFREGIRLGKALRINIDRLCHFAKKDFSRGKFEEAQENYIKAMQIDPTDGRPYLGLSRIAQRRNDLKQARALLKEGIKKSEGGHVVVKGPGTVAVVEGKKGNKKKNKRQQQLIDDSRETDGFQGNDDMSVIDFEGEEGRNIGTIPDLGPNPFLLQALGTLEQKLGNLAAAEELYLQAVRSRPSHAAAWVSLAQLRTKELRQGPAVGRGCYQSAERELQRIGAKPNAFVYTAWASMEYKKGVGGDDYASLRKSRELYQKALEADPNCSVAYLQLGCMEGECGNYDEAMDCFETVLKFDQRNSRVLQAYAIMESRRNQDWSNSRKVLDLFERALKANPRDAGVYQAYALYVVDLGDIDSARDLLKRGTEVNKRHAPAWQAWGVLETRYSTAKNARDVFQQGIWSCAQPGGGQSGGRRCARLWQAWGVLESREGDHAAARRCFSRALDADIRNVAAVTAWTSMEAELGNFADCRSIFERSLKLFRSSTVDKTAIWRAYEIIEERAGNTREAQAVFQRSMGESMSASMGEEAEVSTAELLSTSATPKPSRKPSREDSRWDAQSSDLDAEVWINNGSIEGKVPPSAMKKLKSRQK